MMFNSTLLIVQLLHSVLKTHPAEAAIAIIHYLKLVNSSLSLFFHSTDDSSLPYDSVSGWQEERFD